MNSSQVKHTDFYTIIPLPDSAYVILIGDTVVGSYIFASIDEAEDYVLYTYEDLKRT